MDNIAYELPMPKFKYQKDCSVGKGLNIIIDPILMRSFNTESEAAKFDIRAEVLAAEAFLKEQPQVQLRAIHHFSKGVYAREIRIPAGVILTGEIHKFENLNILSQGRMQVLTESGVEEIEAPFTIISPAGTKRIAYTLTECVWTTIHGTNLTDVREIEKVFIAKSEQEWLDFCGLNQLELKL